MESTFSGGGVELFLLRFSFFGAFAVGMCENRQSTPSKHLSFLKKRQAAQPAAFGIDPMLVGQPFTTGTYGVTRSRIASVAVARLRGGF